MEILTRTDLWVAVNKAAGDHVHPPEDKRHRVSRNLIILYRLRKALRRHVYPVHRLDAATSGVLIMALTPEAASFLGRQFQERRVQKTYHAIVRGWPPSDGVIDRPLASDSTGEMVEAVTRYRRLGQMELPESFDPRFPCRYSLLELEPLTGRFHQIRRHLNRISHPIVGDGAHGDYRHNRHFKSLTGIGGLCLKAQSIGFHRPDDGEWIEISAPDCERWSALRANFQSVSSSPSSPSSPKSLKSASSSPKSSNADASEPEPDRSEASSEE